MTILCCKEKTIFFISNKINTLTPLRDQENCSVIEWLSYRVIRLLTQILAKNSILKKNTKFLSISILFLKSTLRYFYIDNSCGYPGSVDNGNVIGDDYSFGKTVSYQCKSGHRLSGNSQRRCLDTGSWTGSKPVCQGMKRCLFNVITQDVSVLVSC